MCKVIDFVEYKRKMEQIIVSRPSDEIPAKYITSVDLVPYKGIPAVLIQAKGKEYIYIINDGIRIFIMNDFLKGLNLDVEIKFESYKQYGNMLMKIDYLLHQRNSQNDIVSL